MNHLYQVDDGSNVEYSVVAPGKVEALAFVLAQDRDEGSEPPFIVGDRPRTEGESQTTFQIDGEVECCTIWFAYLLVREFGTGILACSEW